jgi:hypothetical protein
LRPICSPPPTAAAPVFGIIHLHTPHSENQAGETRRDSIPYIRTRAGSLFFLARIQLEQLLCFAVLSSRLFLLPPIFIRLLRPHIKFIHSSAIYSAVCTRCCCCCCWMRASERVCFSKIHFFSFAQSRLRMRARGPGENRFLSVALPRSLTVLYSVHCVLWRKKGCGGSGAN